MTTHIQQRGYADCGVACIAMAAEVEYERVLASVAPDVYFHGMYWGEILHALKKITKHDWMLDKKQDDIQLADLNFPLNYAALDIHNPSILYVERDFQYEDPLIKSHYIFCKDGFLYDPTRENEVVFNQAKKTIVGSWKVIATIFQNNRDFRDAFLDV